MKAFANRLRARASQLGISNAEVARRLRISERRYAHYVSGDREPDLQTLVSIAHVLMTSPDQLLEFDREEPFDDNFRNELLARIAGAAMQISPTQLELFAIQIEAVGMHLSSKA